METPADRLAGVCFRSKKIRLAHVLRRRGWADFCR